MFRVFQLTTNTCQMRRCLWYGTTAIDLPIRIWRAGPELEKYEVRCSSTGSCSKCNSFACGPSKVLANRVLFQWCWWLIIDSSWFWNSLPRHDPMMWAFCKLHIVLPVLHSFHCNYLTVLKRRYRQVLPGFAGLGPFPCGPGTCDSSCWNTSSHRRGMNPNPSGSGELQWISWDFTWFHHNSRRNTQGVAGR